MENYSLYIAIGCAVVALIALIAFVLVRNNIADMLDKNRILFDGNFAVKENAISNAMMIADDIEKYGKQLLNSANYIESAQKAYNELFCVLTDLSVAEKFRQIALDSTELSEGQIRQFKLDCRRDIGLSMKNSKKIKNSQLPPVQQTVQAPRPVAPVQNTPTAAPRPVTRPANPNGNGPVQRPIQRTVTTTSTTVTRPVPPKDNK